MRLIGRRSTEDYEKPDDNHSVKDLLGLMINASTNLKANKHPVEPITVLDIVEECKTFFFAGKQTTSNLLTWATVLLAMHPNWQERARQEVLEVCGSELPNKDHLFKLKTVLFLINFIFN